jgi:hypothetical protein
MFRDEQHPDVSLSDWTAFQRGFSPYLCEAVMDRYEISVPKWFVPLARGVAIASPALLRRAGYLPGMHRHRGWHEMLTGILKRDIDLDSHLTVRNLLGGGLWTIEHWGSTTPFAETLVFRFGSTPVFTRNPQSATYLAELCFANPPGCLRWIKTSSSDHKAAATFAFNRRFDEIDAGLVSKAASPNARKRQRTRASTKVGSHAGRRISAKKSARSRHPT